MKLRALSLLTLALALGLTDAAAPAPLCAQDQTTGIKTPGQIDWIPVPGPGKRFKLNDGSSFSYEFSQKPQMGTVILVIRVTDKNGDQVLPYRITGRADMPSMRGGHDSGEMEFRTNKANNYLLPVNVVMPGDWEVRITFSINDNAVFHGSIRFNV